jgi:hypothetical protein
MRLLSQNLVLQGSLAAYLFQGHIIMEGDMLSLWYTFHNRDVEVWGGFDFIDSHHMELSGITEVFTHHWNYALTALILVTKQLLAYIFTQTTQSSSHLNMFSCLQLLNIMYSHSMKSKGKPNTYPLELVRQALRHKRSFYD